jgi:Domain of unknown function (DUF4398)
MILEPPARHDAIRTPAGVCRDHRDRDGATMTTAGLRTHRPLALLAMLLAATLVACAGAGSRPASLMEAYRAVEAARSDRKVRALAPAGLYDAEAALAQAFRGWQSGQPERKVNHLAEVARQHAKTARSHAIERLARDEIEILEAQAPRRAPEPTGRALKASVAPGRPADGADALLLDASPMLRATDSPAPAAGEPAARLLHLTR